MSNNPKDETNARIIARYKQLYEELLTPEEKKHLILLIRQNQPELVGREDLKRRLMANLFAKMADYDFQSRSSEEHLSMFPVPSRSNVR